MGTGTDFLGRPALEAARAAPLAKRFSGFVLDDPGLVLVGRETILRDGQPVGYLTSGGFGYTLDRLVGYGYVHSPAGVAGDWLMSGRYELVVAGETVPASIDLRPFHDPGNDRVRA
jgi:4-methylaminobutanoate oxidase (formaldehyde-forming)